MNFRITFCLSFLMAFFFHASLTQAQCKAFAKETCLPLMAPFTHNGQLNSVTLTAGHSVQLEMTFYKGQNYRILVCAQEVLGKVTFKVFDADKNLVYSSKEKAGADYWDFNLKSTQQLFIEVAAALPPGTSNNNPPSGCVTLLVGFEE